MSLGKNLKRLRESRKMTFEEVGKAVGTDGQAIFNLEKRSSIRSKFAPALARLFNVSVEQLMSDDMNVNITAGPEIRGQVPLISWVRAGEFCEATDQFALGDAEKWLSCPVPHGPHAYCLRVVGRSMDGDDGYREGEIIFVDPDVEALPGLDVVVRTPDGNATFKRLKQDVDGPYLLALNPRWEPNYIKMPEGSHICGVVIFAGRETGFKR